MSILQDCGRWSSWSIITFRLAYWHFTCLLSCPIKQTVTTWVTFNINIWVKGLALLIIILHLDIIKPLFMTPWGPWRTSQTFRVHCKENEEVVGIEGGHSHFECYHRILEGFLEFKDGFTLWSSKSRGHGIEWPNFVESPKKWVETT
jgi:hypothetical protein